MQNYINNINRLFVTGDAREHSYRGDLQQLLNKIIDNDDIVVTNEPAKDDTVTLNINKEVSITNIPLTAWEFYIGGYQPAQKWLKDRVGRNLSRTDIKHYNRIINALIKTDEIMKEVDEVLR